MQEQATQTDPKKNVYTALSKDPKYSKHVPSTYEKFLEGMTDEKVSSNVYNAMAKDPKYKKHLPDSARWATTFAGEPVKKKDETSVPPSATITPVSPDGSTQEGGKLTDQLDVQAAEGIDLNTPEGIQKKFEADLTDRANNTAEILLEDIQAEFDAGTITEEQANKKLQNELAKQHNELVDTVDAEFQEELKSLKDRQAKQAEEDQLAQGSEVKADVPSRLSGDRLRSEEELEQGRENVKLNEEKVKLFNKLATEQLANLPKDIPKTPPTHFQGGLAAGSIPQKTPLEKINNHTRNILEKLSSMSAGESAGFFAGLGDVGVEATPFIGSLANIPELIQKRDVLNKPENERTESEQLLVQAITLMNSMEQSGLKPTAYEWGEMVGMMIPFIGEFVATGGVAATVGKSVGIKLLKGGLKRGIANYTIRGTSMALTQAALTPERIVEESIRRQAPIDVAILDLKKGEVEKILRQKEGETVGVATAKATLTHISEMLTERLGFAYGAGAKRFMKSKIAKAVINKETMAKYTFSLYAKRHGIQTASEFKRIASKTGVNNIFSEVWGEEMPNLALNEVITGDSGKTILENLDPLNPDLLNMIVPISILAGSMYAPSAIRTGVEVFKERQLTRAVKDRKLAVSKIKNGSTLTVKGKEIKRIDGVWKAQDKNGVWKKTRAQEKIDGAYLGKTQEQKSSDGAAATAAAIRKRKSSSKEKVVAEKKTKTEPVKSEPPVEKQPSTLKDNEVVAKDLKMGDVVIDQVTGNPVGIVSVSKTKDGSVTYKDSNGLVTTVSESSIINTQVAATEPVKKKPATKAKPVQTTSPSKGKEISFKIGGVKVKFSPKADENGFFFKRDGDGVGFFNKENADTFGKPTKANFMKIAKNYIESEPGRKKTFNTPAKTATTKPVVKKKAKLIKPKPVTKTEPTKAPVKPKPIQETLGDPNLLQHDLSAKKKASNKTAELLASAKARGWVKKNGEPSVKGLKNNVGAIITANENNQKATAKAQKAYDKAIAAKKSGAAKKVKAPVQTKEERLEEVKKELRQMSAAFNSPTNKGLRSGQEGKKGLDKTNVLLHNITRLKKERDALRAEIGESGGLQQGLNKVDENATIKKTGEERVIREKNNKKSKVLSREQDYEFTVSGIEGTITERTDTDGKPLYYGSTKTKVRVKKNGKTTVESKIVTTNGRNSPVEVIRELKHQLPKTRSQTEGIKGKINATHQGSPVSRKIADKTQALHSIPQIVRTELGETFEIDGKPFRKMRLYVEGGYFTTVLLTPSSGKPFAIGKGGALKGKPVDIKNNKKLQGQPKILEALVTPSKAKPVTSNRIDKTTVEVDHTIEDPLKMTETPKLWAKNKKKTGSGAAKKIRSLKSPKGAALDVTTAAVDAALEAAATVIETGGQFVDAIRAAIKSIRLSDWYKNLSPTEQATQERIIEDQVIADYKLYAANLTAKQIDGAVNETREDILLENKQQRKDAAHRMIFDRRAALSIGAFKTRMFVEYVNLQTNKKEREILPFIVEKTGIPEKLDRPDLKEAYENRDVAKLDKIAKEIKAHNELVWNQMTKGAANMQESLIEDYVTHIWDIKKNEHTDVVSHFTTTNKWAQPRYINTLKEGIDRFGLQPKMLDISEILTVHGSMANNVEANTDMLNSLKHLRVAGKKVVVHTTTKNIASNWVTLPGLPNFRVNPEIANALIPIFQTELGKDRKIVQAIEKANAYIKGIQLTVSAFHHGALIEAALPLLGVTAVRAVLKESFGRAALAAQSKITGNKSWAQLPYAFQHSVLAEDALLHGVQLGASIDIRVKEMNTMFESVAEGSEQLGEWIGKGLGGKTGKKIGGAVLGTPGKAVALAGKYSGVQGLIEANNALLWDYLHDTLKLMAYEKMVTKIPSNFDTPELIRKYKIEQGQFVNDSFGGQNFDVLGISPLLVQASRWLLLSPDWTLSTLRQAAPVVLGIPYLAARGVGAKGAAWKLGKAMGAQFEETAGVRAWTGLGFWFRSALIYGIMYNMYNAFNRKRDMEEHPELYSQEALDDPMSLTMLGNSAGHKTHVFDGRYEDGQERNLRVGKQFRELPELFMDDTPDLSFSIGKPFLKKIGGKLSPLVQLTLKSLTGKTGSGYEDFDLKDKESWAWSGSWLKMAGKTLSPFALSSLYRDDKEFHALDLVFPSSKGLSFSKGVKLLKYYMATDQPDKIRLVQEDAVRNRVNVPDMFTVALTQIKADMKAEISMSAKEIEEVYAKIADPNTPAKDIKVFTDKAKKLEVDNLEKELGFMYITKNMADWARFKIQNGNLTNADIEALKKAATQTPGKRKK